ncbi:MAG: peptidylprolyl isomerase [Rhodospirillaceae bacterium]
MTRIRLPFAAPLALSALLVGGSLVAPVLTGWTGWGVAPVLAQDSTADGAATEEPAPEDPVVAKFKGGEIRLSEVEAYRATAAQQQPQLASMPLSLIFGNLLQQMVNQRIVAHAGVEAGVTDNPVYKQEMEAFSNRLAAAIYIEERVEEAVTEEAVMAEYERLKADYTPVPEYRARHILVEAEEEAKALIAELAEGKDFAELAQEKSTGPSGQNGGELGWFQPEQMVPEFSNAVVAMEIGAVSETPVQSQFGWHVIKLEETRDAEFSELVEIEPQIRQALNEQTVTSVLAELYDAADVTLMTPDGEPLPTGQEPGDPTQPQ